MQTIDVIRRIIDLEICAEKLYRKIALEKQDEIARVALALADEEKKHAQKLDNAIGNLTQQDIRVEIEWALYQKLEDIFQTLNSEQLQFDKRKELFKFGLQLEKDTQEFYQEIEKQYDENMYCKKLFLELAQDENKHTYAILKILHQL